MSVDERSEYHLEDEDGFLKEMSTWSREVAEDLARKHNIGPLCEDHWKVIEFIKDYYLTYGQGPSIVKLCKATRFSRKYICELFPCGFVKGAYRLAGLPRPAGCV